jgi:hypothetical protein
MGKEIKMYATVDKDDKFTGVTYSEMNGAIESYHTEYGLTYVEVSSPVVNIGTTEVPSFGSPTTKQKDLYITNIWKSKRQDIVDNIEVTYNGIVYQGDEISQNRMNLAINVITDDTTTINWTAKNNSVVALNRVDLRSILIQSATQQMVVWNDGRP